MVGYPYGWHRDVFHVDRLTGLYRFGVPIVFVLYGMHVIDEPVAERRFPRLRQEFGVMGGLPVEILRKVIVSRNVAGNYIPVVLSGSR